MIAVPADRNSLMGNRMTLPSPTDYSWSDNFDDYVACMTRGHGYGGEKFWDEEEQFLKDRYKSKQAAHTLSMGCGLFRELDTLKLITRDEIWGMDAEQDFIHYIKKLETPGLPSVKVVHANLYDVHMHPPTRYDLILMLFNTLAFMKDIPSAVKILWNALLPGGTLFLSFWRDTEAMFEERCGIYTAKGDKQARLAENPVTGLSDIVVYKNEIEIFRSAIFTEAFLTRLIKSVIPDAEFTFVELEYARLLLVCRKYSQ